MMGAMLQELESGSTADAAAHAPDLAFQPPWVLMLNPSAGSGASKNDET